MANKKRRPKPKDKELALLAGDAEEMAVGGGLRLPQLPLLLTTANAVNHYVGFMGRQG